MFVFQKAFAMIAELSEYQAFSLETFISPCHGLKHERMKVELIKENGFDDKSSFHQS